MQNQNGYPAPCRSLPSGTYLVSRSKLAGPGRHFGVLIKGLFPYRPECVFQLTADSRYEIITFDTFSHGREVIVHEGKPPQEAVQVMQRARQLTASHPQYDLFANNCEHAARGAFSGRRVSGQIDALLLIGLALIVLAVVCIR